MKGAFIKKPLFSPKNHPGKITIYHGFTGIYYYVIVALVQTFLASFEMRFKIERIGEGIFVCDCQHLVWVRDLRRED